MTKKGLLVWINKEIERSEKETTKVYSEWQEGNDYGWINALQEIKNIYWD